MTNLPANNRDIRFIDDPETLRLIADPLRLRLLELIRQQPRTVTELAEELGVQRTSLYYHIKLLESHNLIVVDTTRVVSGLTEKRYRLAAYRLTVDKTLLGAPGSGNAPLDVFLSVVLDEVAAEIRRSVQSGLIDLDRTREDEPHPRGLVLGRSWYRFTPDQVAAFRDRYNTFITAIEAELTTPPADPAADDTALYEWLIAFFPTVPPPGPLPPGDDTP
ncbi:MAG: winged helix-turn-helix domain-containing protein [Thermomicrobiales bacterium]